MAKVIVFEKHDDVRLATLIDNNKGVCRANFTDIIPCPEELLAGMPIGIVEFCKDVAPISLYFNSSGELESTPV